MKKIFKIYLIVMVLSLGISLLWSQVPIIKQTVHFLLDPSVGNLLNWNLYLGMFSVIFFFVLATTLIQKYTTDQEALKKIRDEQKAMQQEAKEARSNPEKMAEITKKQMESFQKTMEITMGSILYTFIPFILFFRWFSDYFSVVNFKFFGFMSWFWFYLLFSIIFSMILRKVLKVQ
jgi:uncharacterized membrane protein (DUF106 family)